MTHDRAYWEQLWARTMREHPDKVAQRPPNAQRITWVDGDLADAAAQTLRPGGVALCSSLFMVGHRPIDPTTGKPTAAALRLRRDP